MKCGRWCGVLTERCCEVWVVVGNVGVTVECVKILNVNGNVDYRYKCGMWMVELRMDIDVECG